MGLCHSSREPAMGKHLLLHCPDHWPTDRAGPLMQKQRKSTVTHPQRKPNVRHVPFQPFMSPPTPVTCRVSSFKDLLLALKS